MKTVCIITLLFVVSSIGNSVCAGVLFETNRTVSIHVDQNEKQVVQTAVALLQEDVQTVFDAILQRSENRNNVQIIAGTIGQSKEIDRLIKSRKIDLSAISGKWETFQLTTLKDGDRECSIECLIIAGSDPRGTAYGLLELSRMIGVSPWHYFADVKPAKAQSFSFPETTVQEAPSVQYRGIFINDEDWGLMPWATQTLAPQSEKGAVGPEAYEKIFELLLRLRANTIWPAMHECTVPFYFVEGNRQIAEKYGIVVGTSHCEPMMRNSASEWDKAGKGEYNYRINRNEILNYWSERLEELPHSDNILTIGMRGKHDGMMQGVKTVEEYKNALKQVIADQTELIKKYVNKNPADVPQQFVPYKEVLEVYDSGLEVPDYVTLVWCDDNYGYIRRLSNDREQQRSGGAGVYYHVSYWGRPHDYLWLASTSPALIYTEMQRAYEHGANKLWMLNAGDIKPAEYLTEYFLDLAWNIGQEEACPVSTFDHLQHWAAREFGSNLSTEITGIIKEYYRLANFRKPEHTAWSRVEEPGYPRQLTPVQDSEYHPDFRNELQRRIQDYRLLEVAVQQIKQTIPAHRQSAFFQLVEYPVRGASLINQKWLYAQLSRWETDTIQKENNAAKSMQAYREIEKITADYNCMENGKWKRIMDFQPRKLPVFDKPTFSESTESTSVQQSSVQQPASDKNDFTQALNASQADNLPENGTIIEGLGHSFSAVQMKQGYSLRFTFDIPEAGEYWIKTGVLPNHDVNGKGMKIALSINGETIHEWDYSVVGRSETWKQNVLRGQAISIVPYTFPKAGKITISVTALSPYIILDQIMLGKGADNFYEFPVDAVEVRRQESLQ
ncbi:MAG: glycosyl hydrolase 115 family protein [Dysgonamonadaceae bacterium]|nr:glycosyl hydrolase 115 family protein [Dysgonamonadaceae bacterium]